MGLKYLGLNIFYSNIHFRPIHAFLILSKAPPLSRVHWYSAWLLILFPVYFSSIIRVWGPTCRMNHISFYIPTPWPRRSSSIPYLQLSSPKYLSCLSSLKQQTCVSNCLLNSATLNSLLPIPPHPNHFLLHHILSPYTQTYCKVICFLPCPHISSLITTGFPSESSRIKFN